MILLFESKQTSSNSNQLWRVTDALNNLDAKNTRHSF